MNTTEPDGSALRPLRGGHPVNTGGWISLFWEVCAVFFPCTFAVVAIMWALITTIGHRATFFQGLLMLLYLIFIIILIILGVVLLHVTNESSISGMVAQRYNKYSYLTILMITGISFFTSCFIIAGGIVREMNSEEFYYSCVILGALSPLLACCILVLPLVVDKTGNELDMIPLGADTIPAASHAESTYKLFFFPCKNDCMHQIYHYSAVIVGVGLGYASIIIHIVEAHKKLTSFKIEVALLVWSFFCIVVFLFFECVTCCCEQSQLKKQFRLYFEFLGLFFYLMGIIYSSAIAGDFIE